VTFLGDGVPVFRSAIEEGLQVPYRFAPAQMNRQRAASVAALGMKYYEEGKAVLSDDFAPIYLRKSQAEREREEQLAKEQQES
jgi:tRNA threonylcarbamoyladenosine biosynthesis protein TsaB